MRRWLPALSLATGALPGVLLPFALPGMIGLEASDRILLAFSISMIISGVFATGVEASLLSEVSRLRVDGHLPTLRSVSRAAIRCFARLIVPAVATFFLLRAVYAVVDGEASERLFALDIDYLFCLSAASAILAAPWSGTLVALAKPAPVLFSTFFRGGPSLIVLLLTSEPTYIVVSLVVGELMRVLFLRWRVSVALSREGEGIDIGIPARRELFAQSGAQILSQLAPVLARFIFVLGPVGTISAAEMALRIYQIAYQIVYSLFVLPLLPQLAGIAQAGSRATRLIRSTTKRLLAIAAVATILTTIGVVGAALLNTELNVTVTTVSTGLLWSTALLASLPAATLNVWAARGLVTARTARLLPLVSLSALITCALVGFGGQPLMGSVAGVVGLSVSQVVAGALALLLFKRTVAQSKGEWPKDV
ncbi:hypothetical protein [Microbacterium sp. 11MF]|uniref:hypothetical protein n=1 Tax=Microbacterium sp. 11MF TaxID=1169146 RepID=UPI0012DC4D75|nr:hypothetical protein [Microbacterium sp. 11MF]